SPAELHANAPHLDLTMIKRVYSYWDMQTDDLRLTRRIAASAKKLGGKLSEHTAVERIRKVPDGWEIEVRKGGTLHTVSALHVFNALGPWANEIFARSGMRPPYQGVNSKGVHILVPDIGHKVGLFL